MAVLQDRKQSSSDLPPPRSNRRQPPKNKENMFRKKSSSLAQAQMTKSIVVSANPMMPESHKRKRATVESIYDTSQAQSSVLERAQEVEVYIVRSNGLDELDGALGLMRLDACKKRDTGDTFACEREESETLEPNSEDNAIAVITKSCPISDQSESESGDVGFEFLDGLRLSESAVTFEEVKCMDDFNVLVNGLIINSEFSKYILNKYYELCCSQNSFLHEHLLEGLNCKLVAGVISETVNIADAIRACNITTSEGNFSTWDQTLKAFQGLGMNIGFLLARLDQLVSLASKSKRFKEARLEKDQAEEEMRSLEAKLLEVKEAVNRLESEIETLNTSSENPELMFQEVAKSSW